MKVLVLNGSPKKKGTVATLLRAIAEGAQEKHELEWVDLYSLDMKPCIACMKCRPDKICVLPSDDAHIIGEKIKEAGALVIGTPTHWGNMSAQLKTLFDRNVPAFMGEKTSGMPIPRQKGKTAIIGTACSTPWPFNFIASESRGAIMAVREVLHYGGYKILGTVTKPGSKSKPGVSDRLLEKARSLGKRL
jgi:multimeric flavodoxin WrbA